MKSRTPVMVILVSAWTLACGGSSPSGGDRGADPGPEATADVPAVDGGQDAEPESDGRDPGGSLDPGEGDTPPPMDLPVDAETATPDPGPGQDPGTDPGPTDPGTTDPGKEDLPEADPGPEDVPPDPEAPDLPPDPGTADPGQDAALDLPQSACDGGGVPREWYLDCDGDGLTAAGNVPLRACVAPFVPKTCPDGAWTEVPPDDEGTTDCDDQDPTSRPGLDEVCDYRDNDCDGRVDVQPVDGTVWYQDCDGDGVPPFEVNIQAYRLCFTEPSRPPDACQEGTWTTRKPRLTQPKVVDCDDFDPSVNSLTSERCDGKDNDCDGSVDEDSTVLQWYADCDRDGYAPEGAASATGCAFPSRNPAACPSTGTWTLVAPGDGTKDCHDGNALAFPGQARYFTTPIAGRTGTAAWDYDCSGEVDFSFSGDCTNGMDYTCVLVPNAYPSCFTRARGLRIMDHPEVCYLEVPRHQVCGKEMGRPPSCWLNGPYCIPAPTGAPVFTAACR